MVTAIKIFAALDNFVHGCDDLKGLSSADDIVFGDNNSTLSQVEKLLEPFGQLPNEQRTRLLKQISSAEPDYVFIQRDDEGNEWGTIDKTELLAELKNHQETITKKLADDNGAKWISDLVSTFKARLEAIFEKLAVFNGFAKELLAANQ